MPVSPARNKSTLGIAFLLAALAALGTFSIDTYLPSFHDIGAALGATPIEVQQTLTAYMLPFAVMSLWHGAISDTFGRRRVILVGLALFGIASAGCVMASRIEHLWVLRAVQGVSSGAGMIISRAIVRDLFSGAEAQRVMSRITMMFAFAPAIAPVLGGRLQQWFGWRSVFAFLVLVALVLWLICWRFLPETLAVERRQPFNVRYLVKTYWKVMTSPSFLFGCASLGFTFSGFFLYVMSAPVFLMRHLGVPETGFFWLFGPAMAGLMGGAWLSGRFAGKYPPQQTIMRGFSIMSVAVLCNVGWHLCFPPMLPWSVVPVFIYTLGMSLATPCLTLSVLDPYHNERGLAASCQGFLQSLINALVAGAIAPLLWSTALSMAWSMGGMMVIGATAAWLHYRLAHREVRG